MAEEIGDAASAAGYQLVPETGENGRVRWGAREFNRTRDYIALLAAKIPQNKSDGRKLSGITSGTAAPLDTDGNDGDIYFRIL